MMLSMALDWNADCLLWPRHSVGGTLRCRRVEQPGTSMFSHSASRRTWPYQSWLLLVVISDSESEWLLIWELCMTLSFGLSFSFYLWFDKLRDSMCKDNIWIDHQTFLWNVYKRFFLYFSSFSLFNLYKRFLCIYAFKWINCLKTRYRCAESVFKSQPTSRGVLLHDNL